MENRASFPSKQVIVSYPRGILSQPLWKSYSYFREFLSFPTAQCGNTMFLFKTFFLCFLIFEIELKPARFVNLLSAWEFSCTRKCMMLGLLTFTTLKFLMTIYLEVLLFEKNTVCFQKWSRLQIVPFPSVRQAWDENPALNCWCSVSCHIKMKIETVQ